jgi:hypoxanthine phosphoribosyltransferase
MSAKSTLFDHSAVFPIADSVTSAHNTGSGASVVVVDADVVVGAVVAVDDDVGDDSTVVVVDDVSGVTLELVHAPIATTTPTRSTNRLETISSLPNHDASPSYQGERHNHGGR